MGGSWGCATGGSALRFDVKMGKGDLVNWRIGDVVMKWTRTELRGSLIACDRRSCRMMGIYTG